MADQYFHFTLGPVQAFVAQARRTRDFWAGSFLLSWLASVAMQEVKAQGGEIEFPLPDDDYLKYLTGAASDTAKAPKQGSIPNRFKAMKARVPEHFNPALVTEAVQKAWTELAELVWSGDLSFCGNQTRAVWDRQVTGFWDMTWVLTENASESNLLDRRKNWRTYMAPTEGGVSCMMMDGWQELSAELRPGKALNQFWREVLFKSAGSGLKTDLRPGEYLCAIAFIKRRFARYFQNLRLNFDGPVEGYNKWRLHGWSVPVNVPSVNYLAAAPWLANSILLSRADTNLHAEIKNLEFGISQLENSREVRSFSITRVAKACEDAQWQDKGWKHLNGRYFYEDELVLMRDRSDDSDEKHHLDQLLPRLQKIQRVVGKPSDFYAILLMDGDSLGSQMSDANKQTGISSALNAFTRSVAEVVNQYSGFLVYAGGDDVLALLSVDDALACADALRQHYNQCFANENLKQKQNGQATITSSLSGALLFCHYKTPLAQNLAKAHPLLDDIAKDECGRDSLAVRVMKPGGEYCTWSTPWVTGGVSRVEKVNQLAALLMAEKAADDRFSRKFFFKLEELVDTLGLDRDVRNIKGELLPAMPAEMIEKLFSAAWAHTGKAVKDLPKQLAPDLLALTRVWRRSAVDSSFVVKPEGERFDTGALKLLHFLTTELQSIPGSAFTDTADTGKDA